MPTNPRTSPWGWHEARSRSARLALSLRGPRRLMQVQLHIGEGVGREQAYAARERLATLDRRIEHSPTDGRLSLRRLTSPSDGAPYLVEASVVVDGRLFAARATGESVLAAAAEVADKLARQTHRAGGESKILVPRKWVGWARQARHGWRWQGDDLVRELRFRDFDEGMAFLEQVARRAEDYKRRPDMSISANRVRLRIANPHRAGITLAELRLADKVNAIVEGLAGDGPRPR